MNYSYYLKENKISDELGEKHTVYGIEAISKTGDVLQSFADIFFDRKKAERLVTLCNDGELSLLHFADAVEDALIEQNAL